MQAPASPRRPLLPTLAIAVIAVVPFLPALRGGFLYDDHPLIVDNPYIHRLHWFARWFTSDFWNVTGKTAGNHHVGYWRPLVTASYALDWQLSHGPLVFHLTNLMMHAAVCVLVFVALRRWLASTWPAFAAAALFAIHPTKAECVAWISGRTDLLCALGVLLAGGGIARRLRGARGGIALEVAGTVVAYLSKEQAVILPVFACIEAWVALGRPAIDLPTAKRAVRTALPQLGVAVAYVVLRALVLPIGAATPIPLLDHLVSVLETIGRFVALTFVPRRLSIQHAIVHLTHHHMVHAWGYVALGGAATATLVALAVALRRRWPAATVGIGMYLVILLPTSNLKYTNLVELVSERFLYLPVLGLALVAGAALAAADATWRRRGFALAAACGLALGAISASRAADFANEDAFWQREIAMHPDGPQAQQYILDKAILDNQYKAALRILGDMTAAEASYDPAFDRQEMIASYASLALMHLIPDHDPAALRALDTFIKELLAHDRPVARLSVRGVKLAVSMDSPTFAKTLEPYAPALEAYRADIASRLGDDTAALRLAAASRVLCKLCMASITADALAHARSGRLDVALAIVNQASADVQSRELDLLHQQIERARRDAQTIASTTGTAQLAARGQLLGDLTLWGRAYDTLAPHRTELLQVPDAAKTFAELAFRAGEPKVARDVLTAVAPGDLAIDFQVWTDAMGWSDDSAPTRASPAR